MESSTNIISNIKQIIEISVGKFDFLLDNNTKIILNDLLALYWTPFSFVKRFVNGSITCFSFVRLPSSWPIYLAPSGNSHSYVRERDIVNSDMKDSRQNTDKINADITNTKLGPEKFVIPELYSTIQYYLWIRRIQGYQKPEVTSSFIAPFEVSGWRRKMAHETGDRPLHCDSGGARRLYTVTHGNRGKTQCNRFCNR